MCSRYEKVSGEKMMQSKNENKKIIYDGISISVRALTFFILFGLVLMGAVMWYGAYLGTLRDKPMPVNGDDVYNAEKIEENAEGSEISANNHYIKTNNRRSSKINQKFIDKNY